MLISRGNLKLGVLPSFSLPVITTCPGKTPFCERYCYGLRGNFNLLNVKEANDRRLDASLREDFADIITSEIRKARAPAFRLHVVGDFYSVEYIEKWIDVAERLPDVIFFGSTRSWRCDFLAEAMKRLRNIRNVYMKASVDFSDSLQPETCGWNVWSIEGKGIVCPHDEGKVENCFFCGLCWKLQGVDIQFKLRWGKPSQFTEPLPLYN